MIVYALLIALCVLVLRFVAFRYKLYRTVGHLPGPPVNFLLGNTLELVRYDTQGVLIAYDRRSTWVVLTHDTFCSPFF